MYSCDTIIGDSHASSLYSAVIMRQAAAKNLSVQCRRMRQILTENKTIRLLKIWNVELIVSNGQARLPGCSTGKVTTEVSYEA